MDNNYLVDEFRGTDELYCAEVLSDDNDDGSGYTTGTVFKLAPVAEISKTTDSSSDTKYYDNAPANTINAEGADTITLTVPALPVSVLALITGKSVDAATGAMMDGEAVQRYFALGYRLGLTDGTYRYVWRYKGSFQTPEETSATKNNTTDTNNQQLTYTGISTQHKFTKPNAPQRALVVDERDGLADVSSFFSAVTTCDTLPAKTPAVTYTITNTLTHCSNSNSATSIAKDAQYTGILTADEDYTLGEITVTIGGTDVSETVVSGGFVVIPAVTGNVVITCEATS